MTFDKAKFWVRVYDLSINVMALTMEKAIGIAIWKSVFVGGSSGFKKPLRMGIMLNFEGRKIWAILKYERLPNFCYSCGVLWSYGSRW
ncbi:hypothetical protein V2J09_017941 [Rumex salicifolius]